MEDLNRLIIAVVSLGRHLPILGIASGDRPQRTYDTYDLSISVYLDAHQIPIDTYRTEGGVLRGSKWSEYLPLWKVVSLDGKAEVRPYKSTAFPEQRFRELHCCTLN